MSNAEKIEFRCKGCGKLLAVTDGNANIVCPRCSGMNKLSIQTRKIEFIPRNMRSRKTQPHPKDADAAREGQGND